MARVVSIRKGWPEGKKRRKANDRWVGTAETARAKIKYMWRDEAGEVHHRERPWNRPQTEDAIADWMQDYFDRVASGYVPEGFTVAPMPHCARVTVGTLVKAEWKPRISQPIRVGSRIYYGPER